MCVAFHGLQLTDSISVVFEGKAQIAQIVAQGYQIWWNPTHGQAVNGGAHLPQYVCHQGCDQLSLGKIILEDREQLLH